MQLENSLALTLTRSPRRGNRFLPRLKQSPNCEPFSTRKAFSLSLEESDYAPLKCPDCGRNLVEGRLVVSLARSDSASHDRPPNGACVPVGEPGPKIPADSLVRRRAVGTARRHPV